MKQAQTPRTAHENLLHRNRVTYREAGRRIGCSGEYVRLLAAGLRPVTGETGKKYLDLIASLKSPTRQSGIADETAPADRPRSAGAPSLQGSPA